MELFNHFCLSHPSSRGVTTRRSVWELHHSAWTSLSSGLEDIAVLPEKYCINFVFVIFVCFKPSGLSEDSRVRMLSPFPSGLSKRTIRFLFFFLLLAMAQTHLYLSRISKWRLICVIDFGYRLQLTWICFILGIKVSA